MNGYELACLLLAEIALFVYLRHTFKSARTSLLLCAVSALPLYLSIERTTQFLTVDERYIIQEPLDLRSSDLQQWNYGALRTTDAVVGLAAEAVDAIFHPTALQRLMLAKAFHWLIGLPVLLLIHALLDRHFVPRSHRVFYYIVFIFTAYLLPTNMLAWKVFNYDLLSLLMATLGVLLALLSITLSRTNYATYAIVTSTLASQEKLVASPVLILSICVYAILRCKSLRYSKCTALVRGVIVGSAIAVATSAITFAVVGGLRHLDWAGLYPYRVLDPLVSWTWPVVMFTIGTQSLLTNPLPSFAGSVVAMCVLAAVSLHLAGWAGRRIDLVTSLVSRANILLVATSCIVGAVSTFLVRAYWAPYAPIEPEEYVPVSGMNGAIWHFGARTLGGHVASFVAYAYAVLINAIPTVYWLCFFGALVANLALHRKQKSHLGLELLLAGALLMPLAFGLSQVPVGNKYLNVALFAIALVVTLRAGMVVGSASRAAQLAYTGAVGLLLCSEVLPFAPLYAAFRPIWSHYDDVDSRSPVVGQINPWWLGWGEEVMLAGQELERRCGRGGAAAAVGETPLPCDSINLYFGYPGQWLGQPMEINQVWIADALQGKAELHYTERDYYVLNRSILVQEYLRLPTGVQPEFVIQFRGYVQAWVFRGDRLRDAGFAF